MAHAESAEAEALRRLQRIARFGSTIARAKLKMQEDEKARGRARQVMHSSPAPACYTNAQPANPSTDVVSDLHTAPSGHHILKSSELSLASPRAHKLQNKPASTGATHRRSCADLREQKQQTQNFSARCRPMHHTELDVYPSPHDVKPQVKLQASRPRSPAPHHKGIHHPQYQNKQRVQQACSGAKRGPTHHKDSLPPSHDRHPKRLRQSKDDLHPDQQQKSELKQKPFEILVSNRQPSVLAAKIKCPLLSSTCSNSVDGSSGYSCSSSSNISISSALSQVNATSPDVSAVNTTTGSIKSVQHEDAPPTGILARRTPSTSGSQTRPQLRKCPPPPPSRQELLQQKRREARTAMDAIQQTVFFDDAYSIMHDFWELINDKPSSRTSMARLSDQVTLISSCALAASSSNVNFNGSPELPINPSVGAKSIGAILLQQDPQSSRMKPVYFTSKVPTNIEKGYSEAELMMLSLIFAVRKFRSYLLTKPFVILTSENLLPWVSSQMTMSPTISKWLMELQSYEYTFKVENSVRPQLAGILTYQLHEKVIKVPNVRPLPPPPPKVISNTYTLFFDGAFRRATGKAGGGLVLLNLEGEVVMKEQVTLDGSTSNNEAEYDVLISGLKICLAQKIRRLMVKGDALLIVKQILGIWACKNERLGTKVASIRKLFSQFEEVQLYHIPRKENEDANLLAQQAISNQDKAHVVIAAIALKDPQYAGMESLTPVVNYILEGEFPKEFTTRQRRKLIKQASTFLWLEGALYQKGKDLVCRRVPSTNEIPNILKDVQHWCRSCHNCQVNGNKRLLYGPRQAVIANGPFEKWGIDAMGPLPRTANGKL
ncbi:hypothetical protein L7F22_005092 [Adiantum nelumboides]|nr:hypothetical protein [Adiantum nelumboides]